MKLKRPWLLVFDLDGTLVDSSLDLCLSVNAALAHVGAPCLAHDVIASYIGDGAATLVRRALGDLENSRSSAGQEEQRRRRFEQTYLFFLRFYREHKLDNTRLYQGVLPSLERIRGIAPEVEMAVLTNKPVGPSQEICDALGVSPYVFANYGGDSFETKKPDPSGLKRLMAEAERRKTARAGDYRPADKSGVVMIGDSEVDVLTARGAGVRSLGCLYGLSPQGVQAAQPDLLCSSPQEWPRLLGFED